MQMNADTPDKFLWLQNDTDSCRCLQINPDGSKWFYFVQTGSRCFKIIQDGSG